MPRGMRDQGVRLDTFESERDASPMKPAAVRPTGPAVMEPVVVDYADVNAPRASAKNSRYYSKQGRQSWWKRVSQIGRAY